MQEWTETTVQPAVPRAERRAKTAKGAVTVQDNGDPPAGCDHITADRHWSAHVMWSACWTTEARAQRIGEMALDHLRELEAEIRLMDQLPENAREAGHA